MRTGSPALKPATSHLRRWSYMLSGVLVGALFLYLTARNVDLDKAAAAIYAINGWWMVPLAVVYSLTFFVRSLRWQLMFPDDSRPSLRHTIDAFMIGKVSNNFLPGRLGELIRAAVIGRILPKVGLTGSLATIVLEKFFDLLAVILLLGIALLSAPLPPWASNAGLALIATALLILLTLVAAGKVGARVSYASGNGPDSGVVDRVKRLTRQTLQKFSTGLFALRSLRHFTALSALTLFLWFWEVIIIYICLQAFSIPVPFTAAIVALVFLCLGTMLPSAPGFIGTYQLFIVAALQLYAVPETSAFALSVFLNLFMIVISSILGAVAIVLDGGLFNLKQVLSSLSKSDSINRP